jgi:hypothetical protein
MTPQFDTELGQPLTDVFGLGRHMNVRRSGIANSRYYHSPLPCRLLAILYKVEQKEIICLLPGLNERPCHDLAR